MAQIEIRLSQKVNKLTGKAEILLRLHQGKKYDLYAKTGIFILPRYFEYNELEELFKVPDTNTSLGQRDLLL